MSNTIQHMRADLMFLYAADAKTTDKPWTRWQKKVDGEWVQCETTLHGTLPNTDAAVWLSLSANTNSLKAKRNRLQMVRRTGTFLTLKPMDSMRMRLNGKD